VTPVPSGLGKKRVWGGLGLGCFPFRYRLRCPLRPITISRKLVKKVFEELLRIEDRAVLVLLTQLLARLAEATKE
jgi:hypothetical protein